MFLFYFSCVYLKSQAACFNYIHPYFTLFCPNPLNSFYHIVSTHIEIFCSCLFSLMLFLVTIPHYWFSQPTFRASSVFTWAEYRHQSPGKVEIMYKWNSNVLKGHRNFTLKNTQLLFIFHFKNGKICLSQMLLCIGSHNCIVLYFMGVYERESLRVPYFTKVYIVSFILEWQNGRLEASLS